MTNQITTELALTEEEKTIFSTLLEASRSVGVNATLRVAGGWVRDKMLGKESGDIDIALDMMGKDFAEAVKEYLDSCGEGSGKVGVIQANPDQSKHLETATMKVHGVSIDFVNLRKETYASDSRIPEMEVGTAEEDAFRRDFTINSLFYNINEAAVEDKTGLGIDDLRAGLLRTPLDPKATFLDDPLRVLRGVRFSSRFGFPMVPEAEQAAASPEVRDALAQKVSRERVGTETEGMLCGPDPVSAVRTLQRLNLFSVVFYPPPSLKLPAAAFSHACACTLEAAWKLCQHRQAAGKLKTELGRDDKLSFLLAALMLPLRQLEGPSGKKGRDVPLVLYMVREPLKWKIKIGERAALLLSQASELKAVHVLLKQGGAFTDAAEEVRVRLGWAIRKAKQDWVMSTMLAALLTMPEAAAYESEASRGATKAELAGARSSAESSFSDEQLLQADALCDDLQAAAEAFQILNAYSWQPLLNGKEVMEACQCQGGPQLGILTEAVMKWQLAHPGANKEDCKAWLVENSATLLPETETLESRR